MSWKSKHTRLSCALGAALLIGACGGNPPPEDVSGMPAAERMSGAGDVMSRAQMEQINPVDMADLLDGRFAGVQVAVIGGRQTLVIRGRANPLVVLDGIPLSDSQAIWSLNPNDIEQIRIVKEGGAALYGIRGSRGVVEIRTRRQ